MQSITYAVLLYGRDWKVVGRRGPIGFFKSAAEAIATGARLADQARQVGYQVEVLVQGDCGQLLPLHDGDEATCGDLAFAAGLTPVMGEATALPSGSTQPSGHCEQAAASEA